MVDPDDDIRKDKVKEIWSLSRGAIRRAVASYRLPTKPEYLRIRIGVP